MRRNWVRVIDRFLPTEDMEDLLASSHIFLLPAARVHIVSLLQAMSYGLALVTSDGWGIEEYVTHEHNGLVVPGRYGKVSWADEEAGMLREDYQPMCTPNRQVIDGLVEAISRLVEDVALRPPPGSTGSPGCGNEIQPRAVESVPQVGVRQSQESCGGLTADPPLPRSQPSYAPHR
ncbi:MAG: hypothetical protein KatS3mg105_1578 [Gemmatales bacterium]|nr:MAG: hypothetical protein KatS3mg105_1578 [Gemmatales bacterium]